MFRGGDYIGIGLSGGKDSAALLYVLKKVFPEKKYIAIHLHHGIGEYSRDSYDKAKALAEMLDIEFQVFNYKELLGITIPDVEKTRYRNKVCSVCGIIRRWALSKAAKEAGVDILATGHNLDDLVEVMFNHFLTGDLIQIARMKPVLPPEHPSQVWKVKPLFRSPEMDNYYYAMFNDLPVKRYDCPYFRSARSIRRKKMMDYLEKEIPNIKFQLMSVFLKKLVPLIEREVSDIEYNTCSICGGPSLGNVCSACNRITMIREAVSRN
jgi:uncharacterized protein (TIGR00269 family)